MSRGQYTVAGAGAYMIVGGLRLNVVRIELAHGSLRFVAMGLGTDHEVRGEPTLFGTDGRGIMQFPSEVIIPPFTAVTVYQPLIITDMTAVPADDRWARP